MKSQKLKRTRLAVKPAQKIAFTLILLWLMMPMVEAQTPVASSGAGTSGSPHLIASLENIYWVSQNSFSWASHFKQTANIDLISISNWTPIGNGSASQTGGMVVVNGDQIITLPNGLRLQVDNDLQLNSGATIKVNNE
jgi:hypothetical protein